MEALLLNFFLALPWQIQLVLMVFFPIIVGLKIYIASTPTPPPNTVYGRVYRVIEFCALMVGKAKDVGVPVPTLQDVQTAFLAEIQASTEQNRPVDLSAVARALAILKPAVKAVLILFFVIVPATLLLSACGQTINAGISGFNSYVDTNLKATEQNQQQADDIALRTWWDAGKMIPVGAFYRNASTANYRGLGTCVGAMYGVNIDPSFAGTGTSTQPANSTTATK